MHAQTAAAHPAPTLVTLRGMIPPELPRPETALSSVLRSAAWVTACAVAVLRDAQQRLPWIGDRSSVIHNGLDRPEVSPAPLPHDPPRLLCLGRLAPEKGFDLALTAFGALVERFPRARLVVAGDGPARAELEQQAERLGLAGLVDFVGWVVPEAVPDLINTATVVVMPSRTEGLPLVAIQAGQMARPIVGTRVGGLPEVVADGQTGALVEPEDGPALAAAVARLLEDPARARGMGDAARRRTDDLFNLERCVGAYDALYRRLIRAPAGAPST